VPPGLIPAQNVSNAYPTIMALPVLLAHLALTVSVMMDLLGMDLVAAPLDGPDLIVTSVLPIIMALPVLLAHLALTVSVMMDLLVMDLVSAMLDGVEQIAHNVPPGLIPAQTVSNAYPTIIALPVFLAPVVQREPAIKEPAAMALAPAILDGPDWIVLNAPPIIMVLVVVSVLSAHLIHTVIKGSAAMVPAFAIPDLREPNVTSA